MLGISARNRLRGPLVLALAAAGPVAITLLGLPYYLEPAAARVRSSWHVWLRPSGYVGQTVGIIAFLIFVFLWLYPVRKRFRWLAFTGAVGRWLDVHVAAALLMPLLVGVHAGWRFEGIIGLGYAAILVVCASGVIGRYLYTRIPRGKSGVELDRAGVAAERRSLLTELSAATGLLPEELETRLGIPSREEAGTGYGAALLALLRADLARWRVVRRFHRDLHLLPGGRHLSRAAIGRVLALARRESALAGQVRMLDATQRVFRLWHVAHRPVAMTALVAVLVHVAVVVALGATWLW
jgi:hypothetical protein